MITTLILLFVIALSLSLVFTPMVRSLGIRFGAMDVPTARKVHTEPIPRIGGLAVFLSFVITSLLAITLIPNVSHLYKFSFNESLGYVGACVVLCCGLWDDFRRLNPWVKLFFSNCRGDAGFYGWRQNIGTFHWHYRRAFCFDYQLRCDGLLVPPADQCD